MSDLNPEDDAGKFKNNPDDDIRPIDIGAPGGEKPSLEDVMPRVLDPVRKEAIPEEPPSARPPGKNAEGQFIISKGNYIDLLERDPAMKQIGISAGWEQKDVGGDKIDIDLACFLLDKTGMTRVDEDFIFYNNDTACDGAVKCLMDSRTGAGDGDDETIFIDFNGVPFDIFKIMFSLSVYDEKRDGLHLGQVRDIYMRLTNKEDGVELVRFPLPENELSGNAGLLGFCLIREGPKWYLEALATPVKGGLGAIAKSYGLIIKEETG